MRSGRFGATLKTVGLKRLVGAMLAAALVVTLTAAPSRAETSKPMACCGKSCPPPAQAAPKACCQISPLPPVSVSIAPLTPPLLAWAILVVMVQPVPRAAFAVASFTPDASPPQADRLAVSGLAPPRLA